MHKPVTICFTLLVMLLVLVEAQAVTYTFTGAGSDNLWTTGANWDPGDPNSDPNAVIIARTENDKRALVTDGMSIFANWITMYSTIGSQTLNDGFDMTGGSIDLVGQIRQLEMGSNTSNIPIEVTVSGGTIMGSSFRLGGFNNPSQDPVDSDAVWNLSGSSMATFIGGGSIGSEDPRALPSTGTLNMSNDAMLTVNSLNLSTRGNAFVTIADNAKIILLGDHEQQMADNISSGFITGVGLQQGEGVVALYDGGLDQTTVDIGIPPPPPDDFTWNTTSGDWNTPGNWTPAGFPGDPNHIVTFADSIVGSPHTVFTNSDVTVNSIAFDNTMGGTYAIMGQGTVNLESGTEPGLPATGISVSAGSHQFQTEIALQDDAVVDIALDATLELVNDLILNGNTLMKTGDGTLIISNNIDTGDGGSIMGLGGVISGSGTLSGDLVNLGGTLSPGASSASDGAQGVPEPSAMVLLAMGMLATVCRRRRATSSENAQRGRRTSKNVLALLLVLCMAPLAPAARTAWIGGTSTDFFDNANWDTGSPVSGDGTKMTDSFLGPALNPGFFHPTLENGSATTLWFEVTHGAEFTIGTDGIFTVEGGSDSSSMAQAAGSTGTLNLVDNGHFHTQSMYAAWEGDAIINMSGTSTWLANGDFQPFTLGHWEDSNRPGVATMTMSGDSRLTVTSGDFRIRGNFPANPAPKSFLIMQDDASVILGGNQEAKIQGYIDDGMLINGEVIFDGTNTIITTTGSVFMPDDDFAWNTTSGDWNTTSNWSPVGSPVDPNHIVTFGDSIGSGAESVYTNSAVTVNSIAFNNALGGSYAIGGTGSVNLESGSNSGLPPSGVTVSAGSHEFQLGVVLQNDAAVDTAAGATLDFVNRLNINTHTLTKTGDGTLIISNKLNTGSGGTLDCQVGTCGGSGTVGGNLNNSSGTVAPGNSPGILTVEGDYTQGNGATLAMEISGLVAGDEHDKLVVTGAANLDGTLDVTLLPGFTPSNGNTFDILDFGTVTGDFATLNLPTDFSWEVSTGVLTFTGVGGGFTDYDDDGTWNLGDLNLVLFNWQVDGGSLDPQEWINGRPPSGTPVGLPELNTVLFSWQQASSLAAVPEPTTATLGLLALVGVCVCRRSGVA